MTEPVTNKRIILARNITHLERAIANEKTGFRKNYLTRDLKAAKEELEKFLKSRNA